MQPVCTGTLLDGFGFDYVKRDLQPSYPQSCVLTFSSIIPEICNDDHDICDKLLYTHQCETFLTLQRGWNVVLVSETGSGKTEAWAMYALRRSLEGGGRKFRVLALYPTKALSNDQVFRLVGYYRRAGFTVDEVPCPTCRHGGRDCGAASAYMGDVVVLDKVRKKCLGERRLGDLVGTARLVVTNPEFLLFDFKERAFRIFSTFISSVNLVVIDELDFYDSARATMLVRLLTFLLTAYSPTMPQFVVISGTLRGVEKLIDYLRKATGRETVKVEGRGFRAKNIEYIVLGRRDALQGLYSDFNRHRDELAQFYGDWVGDYLRDYDTFKLRLGKFLDELEVRPTKRSGWELWYASPQGIINKLRVKYHGFIDELESSAAEILASYVLDRGVTLVFCRTTNMAETLARKARDACSGRSLGVNCDEAIRVHHSKVPDRERIEVERGAREGRVKVVFTVRTLLQGIDIGEVIRVVHVGLPEDVREYIQREGRKGRRRGTMFTETVIFPINETAAAVTQGGFETLDMWVGLGPELTVFDPDNDYAVLFEGLAKAYHTAGTLLLNRQKGQLSQRQLDLLSRFGLVDGAGRLTECGRLEWERFGFYAHEKYPSNIRLYVRGRNDPADRLVEENVALKDYIESYQPGFIDLARDAVVISNIEKRSNRYVWLVRELDIEEISKGPLCIGEALNVYNGICGRWGQSPNIVGDVKRGKVWSETWWHVEFEGDGGFVLYREFPGGVRWYVESRERVPLRIGDVQVFAFSVEHIDIRCRVNPSTCFPEGKPRECGGLKFSNYCYEDFTYAYTSGLDPRDSKDPRSIELGMALVKALLRRFHGVPVGLIKHATEPKYPSMEGPRYVVKLWEYTPAGILKALREGDGFTDVHGRTTTCGDLMDEIAVLPIDDITMMLVNQQSRHIARELTRDLNVGDLTPDRAKALAKRALAYLCGAIYVDIHGEEHQLKWPPQRMVVIGGVEFKCGGRKKIIYGMIDEEGFKWYDRADTFIKELLPRAAKRHMIVHYGNSDILASFIGEFPGTQVEAVDVREKLAGRTNVDGPLPLTEIDKALGHPTGKPLLQLYNELAREVTTCAEDHENKIKERAATILEAQLKLIYIIHELLK